MKKNYEKVRAGDAFGEDRMLEGLDELCSWVEWSTVTVGVDVRPKLVSAFSAHTLLATALESRDEEAQTMALGALASLTQDDELARRLGGTPVRAAIVGQLELLNREHMLQSTDWPRLYAREVAALVAAANMTRPDCWHQCLTL